MTCLLGLCGCVGLRICPVICRVHIFGMKRDCRHQSRHSLCVSLVWCLVLNMSGKTEQFREFVVSTAPERSEEFVNDVRHSSCLHALALWEVFFACKVVKLFAENDVIHLPHLKEADPGQMVYRAPVTAGKRVRLLVVDFVLL